MLQRDRQIRTQVQQLADASLFAASFWLAYALRGNEWFTALFRLDVIPPDAFDQVVLLYFALVPGAPLVLESQGFYQRSVDSSRMTMLWSLLKSCFIITLGLVLLLFLFRLSVPRLGMALFGMIGFGLVWAKEELVLLALHSRLGRAQSRRRIILAGSDTEIARLRRELKAHAADSIEVAAEFHLTNSTPQALVELLHEHSVSGVLVSAKHAHFERVESVIQLCEVEGVEAWLVADFFATQIARASFDEMFGHPLLIFRTTPEASWQMLAKILLDFFGALAALIFIASWLFPLIALAIKITSPGPVLFRQPRSGLNGAPFVIYKFRTMATNAEQFKHELAAMNEMSGPVFKVTNDPRITPFGKWLRKWSFDELPQVFNVLRGEMSLVGPRPLPVDEVRRFSDLAHRRRLSVKPGLTCLWQISGRNKISNFQDWVRLDLQYIDNWSIWLDLQILLRTIPAVLSTAGAK